MLLSALRAMLFFILAASAGVSFSTASEEFDSMPPNCDVHDDPIGASLYHTKERLVACLGLQERSGCQYNATVPLPNGRKHVIVTQGCCLMEGTGTDALYCSSLRSTTAAPAASLSRLLLDVRYTCQGGIFLKTAPSVSLGVKDCSAWDPSTTGMPICTKSGDCLCMRGDQVDLTYGCTCIAPNTGETCKQDSDCSGMGSCTAYSAFAQDWMRKAAESGDVEQQRQRDGSLEALQTQPKPSTWFGDEASSGVQLGQTYEWYHKISDADGWMAYTPVNTNALENAWRAAAERVVVQFDQYAYGDAWVSLTEMRQYDAQGHAQDVRRSARTAGQVHRPQLVDAAHPEVLGSEEAFRRRTLSP